MEEAENIVAQTAERIFADLADAQTVNNDKNGGWKAPLWQALSEAGLPLSWVAEEHGGSGATLAEGFGVLSAAGRFALPVPLAETMLAGWLLSQAGIASPQDEMTVAPAGPKDRITINADGTLSGRARGVPFGREAKHIAVLAQDGKGKPSIALVAASHCRVESSLNLGGDSSDTVTFDRAAPLAINPAPDGFDVTSLLLMGAVVRSLQIAGSLETMLEISVRYSNERVAFEKKISKFQAVQHNLAKLAGESAAALAAATSAADTFASWRCVPGRPVSRSGGRKNPLLGSRRESRRHRPSGSWRDRLYDRTHSASLHAAGAGMARRFRLRKLLGGRTRQTRGRQWRRRIVAAGGFALRPIDGDGMVDRILGITSPLVGEA